MQSSTMQQFWVVMDEGRKQLPSGKLLDLFISEEVAKSQASFQPGSHCLKIAGIDELRAIVDAFSQAGGEYVSINSRTANSLKGELCHVLDFFQSKWCCQSATKH
jgi:hypothetical protein